MHGNISDKLDKIMENQERIISLLEYKINIETNTPAINPMLFIPYNPSCYQVTGNFTTETGIQYLGEPKSVTHD